MSHRFLPAAAAVLAVAAPLALADGAAAASRRAAARTAAPTELLLTFRERPGLHEFVKAVSDPASRRYRQYSTVEALARRYGPTPRARRAVAAWAAANDLTVSVAQTGTFAIASGSATALSAAVGGSGLAQASGRDSRLPVPAALRGSVGSAAVLSQQELPLATGPSAPVAKTSARARAAQSGALPTPNAILAELFGSASERSGTPKGCAPGTNSGETLEYIGAGTPIGLPLYGYTPNQYLTAYGHAQLHRRGFRGEGMRVAVLEIDDFIRSDVETFASCFGSELPKITREAIGRRFPAPGGETTLDLEVLIGSLPKLEAIHVVGTAQPSPASLLKGAIATLGTPKTRPDVVSISLGICEPALAGQVTTMRAFSDVYAVAAGAGISTLVSTGDSGVTGCAREAGPSMISAVAGPSTSPFVTAVGGTNITLDSANRLRSQQVWNNAPAGLSGGGGGISVLFESPWWQGGQQGGMGGRVVPDIAALGDPYPGYAIYCTADDQDCRGTRDPRGGWQTIGGTSAATPLMAAGIVLANQEAKSKGQPPLGLLNPLIYAIGGGKPATYKGAISDVTIGSNDVGKAVPRDAGGGTPIGQFSAEKGYDAATGWGSLKIAGFSAEAVKVAKRQAAKADGDDRRVAPDGDDRRAARKTTR
ncbi:S53 family peptidase [Conexibacter stalactiti]|uniref:S53 family peptidase n=1 Tax=Conexibacter stalactiti TaxID=1940611 RepID=A0ABU4HNL3_9ACTN|nr:S53 family peptidase [Conexibacter stalactiti]MDW5594906.1 S53 family peptidase [Conexibacter stalactiti]MEC5035548.1 S53 family peptidase [Conexibacter stalactiti]